MQEIFARSTPLLNSFSKLPFLSFVEKILMRVPFSDEVARMAPSIESDNADNEVSCASISYK